MTWGTSGFSPATTTMSSKPIQPHTVDLILQYITPSNLQPLPSHLISKPLLQRHHFLEITPENPKEYLCWPSDTHEDLIYLLESRPVEESRPAYDCRYSFDGDFIYAHVNIDRGVRLIFLWDGSDETWRFHDLNAMPFPVEAKGSPQQLSEPEHKPSLVISLDSPTHENGDDDDYWDAYGTDHDEPNGVSHSMKSATEPSTEDAYWAQYNSVHGMSIKLNQNQNILIHSTQALQTRRSHPQCPNKHANQVTLERTRTPTIPMPQKMDSFPSRHPYSTPDVRLHLGLFLTSCRPSSPVHHQPHQAQVPHWECFPKTG